MVSKSWNVSIDSPQPLISGSGASFPSVKDTSSAAILGGAQAVGEIFKAVYGAYAKGESDNDVARAVSFFHENQRQWQGQHLSYGERKRKYEELIKGSGLNGRQQLQLRQLVTPDKKIRLVVNKATGKEENQYTDTGEWVTSYIAEGDTDPVMEASTNQISDNIQKVQERFTQTSDTFESSFLRYLNKEKHAEVFTTVLLPMLEDARDLSLLIDNVLSGQVSGTLSQMRTSKGQDARLGKQKQTFLIRLRELASNLWTEDFIASAYEQEGTGDFTGENVVPTNAPERIFNSLMSDVRNIPAHVFNTLEITDKELSDFAKDTRAHLKDIRDNVLSEGAAGTRLAILEQSNKTHAAVREYKTGVMFNSYPQHVKDIILGSEIFQPLADMSKALEEAGVAVPEIKELVSTAIQPISRATVDGIIDRIENPSTIKSSNDLALGLNAISAGGTFFISMTNTQIDRLLDALNALPSLRPVTPGLATYIKDIAKKIEQIQRKPGVIQYREKLERLNKTLRDYNL